MTPTTRQRRVTFAVMLAGLIAVTAAMAVATVVMTGGTLTYIIDDTYIHLTMARNVAEHASWGMVPGDFESSSSSPGWVLFLATFLKVVPAWSEWWPMVINAVASAGILCVFAARQDVIVIRGRSWWRIGAAFILPSVLYLPALILLGMEHSLHTLLVLGVLLSLERMVNGDLGSRRLAAYGGLLLAACAVRLETACLAFGCGLVLIWPGLVRIVRDRRPRAMPGRATAAFAISGVAPLAVILTIGLVDLAHGEYFLPNSIVEKTSLLGGSFATSLVPSPERIWSNLDQDLFVIALLLFGALAVYQAVPLRRVWIAWIIGTVLHAAYAQYGWWDRYEGYIIITGVFLALRTIPAMAWLRVTRRFVAAMVLLLLALPVGKFVHIAYSPAAAQSQFSVQNQMARFLARYYDSETVMVNDIGHVAWQHSGGLVDMWALGSFEVLKAQHEGYYNADFAAFLAREHDVRVVAEYTPTFDAYVPRGFIKVAEWPIDNGSNSLARAIAFWAPDAASAAVMRQQTLEFAPSLPADGRIAARIVS